MASLRDAYRRVEEQTERNNAAKDEGGNIFQPLFANVLNDLNQDLDPANVNKPLSGYGALLDTVTGFRKSQIEKAAELQANINLKAYEAGEPQRAMELADNLQVRAIGQRQDQLNAARESYKALKPILKVKEESDKDRIADIINKNPPFMTTVEALSKNSIFHTVREGSPVNTSMGEAIYTSPDKKWKLYASGNTAFRNINTGRKKFIKGFNKNLKDAGFSDDRIANLAREDKAELFGDQGFMTAMEKTFKDQPKDFATLLDAHEQYSGALAIKTKQITDRLTKSNIRLQGLLRVAKVERDVASKNLHNVPTTQNEDLYKLSEQRLNEIRKVLLSNELDGRFLQKTTSIIHRNAFAISVVRGIPTNEQTAAQNIDLSIKLSMNDPDLSVYEKQLKAYYYNDQPIVEKLEALLYGKKNLSPAGAVDPTIKKVLPGSTVISGTGTLATEKKNK
jgi:hypothetical protein